MCDDKNESLWKSGRFLIVAIPGGLLALGICLTVVFKDLRHMDWDFGHSGWALFFTYLQPAIYVMGGTLAVLGFITALHRSDQTAEQIRKAEVSRKSDIYHAHRKSFLEYIERFLTSDEPLVPGGMAESNFNPYRLHNSFFPGGVAVIDNSWRNEIVGKVTGLTGGIWLLSSILNKGRNGTALNDKEKGQLSGVAELLTSMSRTWFFVFCTSQFPALTNQQTLDIIRDALLIFHKTLHFEADYAFDLPSTSRFIEEAKQTLGKYNLLDKFTHNLVSDAETYLKDFKESKNKQIRQRLVGQPLAACVLSANESN